MADPRAVSAVVQEIIRSTDIPSFRAEGQGPVISRALDAGLSGPEIVAAYRGGLERGAAVLTGRVKDAEAARKEQERQAESSARATDFRLDQAAGNAAAGFGPGPLSWLQAPVTQGFGPTDTKLDGPYGGYANFNKGYDFGVPIGTPIDAVYGGTVVSAGDAGDGWGISVKIQDAEGYIHNYGHLSSVNVQPGQQIEAGTFIGESGNTGKSTGPHLSYDVQAPDGSYVDPSQWLGGVNAPTSNARMNPTATASAQMGDIVTTIAGMMPTPAQYEDAFEFQAAMTEWMEMMGKATALASDTRLLNAGVVPMPDGSFMGLEDALASDDPAVRKWAEQRQRDVQIGYGSLLDELNLSEFNAYQRAVEAENSRLNTQFTNEMDRFGAMQNYDTANVSRAARAVERMVAGKTESRQRADLITSTALDAAPWAAGGKTEFGMGDLGAGIDALARQANIRPGAPLLKLPGTMRIDPAALMEQGDAALGVEGPLPLIPGLTATPNLIPSLPGSTPIPMNAPASVVRPLLEAAFAGAAPLINRGPRELTPAEKRAFRGG